MPTFLRKDRNSIGSRVSPSIPSSGSTAPSLASVSVAARWCGDRCAGVLGLTSVCARGPLRRVAGRYGSFDKSLRYAYCALGSECGRCGTDLASEAVSKSEPPFEWGGGGPATVAATPVRPVAWLPRSAPWRYCLVEATQTGTITRRTRYVLEPRTRTQWA